MAKIPKCSGCGKPGHYKISCLTTPKTSLKRSTTPLKAKKVNTPTKKKTKAKTRSWYVKELDRVFSLYVRQSKPPVCVTCGKKDEWQNLQNGHYFSRGKYATRWDEMNCWPQCVGCNLFKSGNYTEYAFFMINTLGMDKLAALHKKSNTIVKIPTPVIREKIEEYKQKLLQF